MLDIGKNKYLVPHQKGFIIPPEYQNLDFGGKSLQQDSGANNENQILLFITNITGHKKI